MIIVIFILFVLVSTLWLVISIKNEKELALMFLNLFWWVGSFITAYYAWLVWVDREYSENWAVLGFIFYCIPYYIITGTLIATELFLIRNWEASKRKKVMVTSIILLIFMIMQMVVGFLSTK